MGPIEAMPEFHNLEEIEGMARSSRNHAREITHAKMIIDYYSGSSDTGFSVRENRAGFDRIKILPRILRDVSRINTSVKIFGGGRRLGVGGCESWAGRNMHKICMPRACSQCMHWLVSLVCIVHARTKARHVYVGPTKS